MATQDGSTLITLLRADESYSPLSRFGESVPRARARERFNPFPLFSLRPTRGVFTAINTWRTWADFHVFVMLFCYSFHACFGKLLKIKASVREGFEPSTSPLFEIAFVLVCVDHIAPGIINPNHSIM